jgi:GMP synthase-like glutamine amidotransferase
MQRWTIVQHVPWEGPGSIATEARARGLTVESYRMDLQPRLPASDDVEGLIVMGGPMGVYEAERYPFLQDEMKLIAEIVRRGQPVLGVCLGAQLLAGALGARVYPGPAQEIGFSTVELTANARQDPIFGALADPLPVFHWHGDTFDLPDGAVLLAKNANYGRQAFRVGKNAYGLQFHVELDLKLWKDWRPYLAENAVTLTEQQRAQIEGAGKCLFSQFFDLAHGGTSQPAPLASGRKS